MEILGAVNTPLRVRRISRKGNLFKWRRIDGICRWNYLYLTLRVDEFGREGGRERERRQLDACLYIAHHENAKSRVSCFYTRIPLNRNCAREQNENAKFIPFSLCLLPLPSPPSLSLSLSLFLSQRQTLISGIQYKLGPKAERAFNTRDRFVPVPRRKEFFPSNQS